MVSSSKNLNDTSTRMVFGPGNLFSSNRAACSKAFLLACPSVLALLPLSPNRRPFLFCQPGRIIKPGSLSVNVQRLDCNRTAVWNREKENQQKKKSSQGELIHSSLLNDGQHQIRPLIRPRFCSASKETTTKRHENTLENRPVPERRYKHALNTDIITSS